MDSQLKQRLIGASVLIALAVIFVPMFLSGPPPKQDNETVNLDIPAPPEREFQTRVVPADGGKATSPAPLAVKPAPPPETVATVDTSTSPAPKPDEPAKPAAPAKPTPEPAKPVASKPEPPKPAAPETPKPAAKPAETVAAAEPGGRFLVHLGVYGNATNANALVAAAKKLSLPTQTDSVETDGKAATRVRLGPFADRSAAEAARLKFKAEEPKVPTSIVESTDSPKTDAPASAAGAGHTAGWAVQLGAFKGADEANKLRDKLRAGGFAAFVEPIGQGAERLWRVRAGPEAERGGAERLRDQIRQKLALNGTLVTQP